MSAPFRNADVTRWTGGELLHGDPDGVLRSVTIDSRTVEPGCLFVAIVGPNHDAHRFIGEVARGGAAAMMIEAEREIDASLRSSLAVIAVPDTTQALGALAAGHRKRFRGPVVAITGSSGKTTTKEMCAAILAEAGPCLKTEGNLNNEFGLPLTLLRREEEHERVVVELGMNHRGEIARLAAIARPDVALLTNVGVAHIEFLGSREEIAAEKGDLYAALSASGIAVANRDDPLASRQAERAAGRVIGYACDAEADVRAEDVRFADGRYSFRLLAPQGDTGVVVTGLGETTVTNALGASAAALAAGVDLACVRAGLERYRPLAGRMAPHRLANGATIIDDSYNANPVSMRASLEALAALAPKGRRIAVLGDMGELGDTGEAAHEDTGRWVAELEIDFLCAVGERAEAVVASAVSAGMNRAHAVAVPDPDEASRLIRKRLQPNDWVLIKGSRAMHLERIVEALREEIH